MAKITTFLCIFSIILAIFLEQRGNCKRIRGREGKLQDPSVTETVSIQLDAVRKVDVRA